MPRANKRERQALGRASEQVAAKFLEDRGYRVLERNVRRGRWEVDLVVQNQDALVFVEVRSRSSDRFGCPSESVDAEKQRHIALVAEMWLWGRSVTAEPRFDVIAVVWRDGEPQCRHIPDAFPSPF